MAKGAYIGVAGKASKIKKGYIGVAGVARKIKKAYIGIGGVARPCWAGGEFAAYGNITPLSTRRFYHGGASNSNFALFAGGQIGASSSSIVDTVDLYDKSLVLQNYVSLSKKRNKLCGNSNSERAFFYGGYNSSDGVLKTCDTFDNTLTRQTTNAGYSAMNVSSANIGGYAIFAGGNSAREGYSLKNYVRAFNMSLTMSGLAALEDRKQHIGTASTPNYAFFAGGQNRNENTKTGVAYNTSLTQTVLQNLSANREVCYGAATGNKAIFIGWPVGNNADVYDENLTKTTISRPIGNAYGSVSASFANLAVFSALENRSTSKNTQTIVFDELLTCSLATELPYSARYGAAAVIGDYFIVAGGDQHALTGTTEAYAYTLA